MSEQLRVANDDRLADLSYFCFSHGLEHYLRSYSRGIAHGDTKAGSRGANTRIRRTLSQIIHRSKSSRAAPHSPARPVRPWNLRFDDLRHVTLHASRHSFLSLVNVFYVALENQKIRSSTAINLQRAAIVPLDCSLNLFTVLQDEDHRRVGVDLLFVIVDLGMRLGRRRLSFSDLQRRRLRG